MPHEDSERHRNNVKRLRQHFEQFNVDVSELCQWMMSLRKRFGHPDQPDNFGTLGNFLLEPRIDGIDANEDDQDRWRLIVFDDVMNIRTATRLGDVHLPAPLREAMNAAAQMPRHAQTSRLFGRLEGLNPAHRLVLLKAAAEWIVSRFLRGMQNWIRQHEEWKKEKHAWEGAHPELTEAVRERFTNVFKTLSVPDRDGTPELRRKNPRICKYERSKGNTDNCIYAGQKGHGALCWAFAEFAKAQRAANNGRFDEEKFCSNVEALIKLCAERKITHARNVFLSPNAGALLFPDFSEQKRRDVLEHFKKSWEAYLRAMNLSDKTVLAAGRLPHCRAIGETWEKSKCENNPHTELCTVYRNAVASLDESTQQCESLYRAWRTLYLAGPRKPEFRYPSSRDLPMPKIFGKDFYEIDFEKSLLRLRLDDMAEGEWIEYGFMAWPRAYQRFAASVTSLHVNFVGTRARVGFRFEAPHKASRFGCTQDELDALRSVQFPRRSQDHAYLDAARQRLLECFDGNCERDLRILAVDVGETGAMAVVFAGRTWESDVPLSIVKIDTLYPSVPDSLEKDKSVQSPPPFDDRNDARGLRKEHVGVHLSTIAAGSSAIAKHRLKQGGAGRLRDCDYRGLKRHTRWMIRDWVRHNASQIVKAAVEHRCDLIVFESLRQQRVPGYDQLGQDPERRKRSMAMMSYGRIRHKVKEKAVERGMRVVTVPDYKSSQMCSACGVVQEDRRRLRKDKKKRQFECKRCCEKMNSDKNAARVHARVFWGEIVLPVEPVRTT